LVWRLAFAACAAATRLSSGTSLFSKDDVERLYSGRI
jgi:hypothetical protein